MPERDRPDIDHTRDAMRRHDERVAGDPEELDASEDAGEGEDDEEDDA